eukprot:scaffold111935_cov44-Prasinocladus_malaysianus.AAC.1
MVQGVLDQFVQAVTGIPRLGANVSGGFSTTGRAKQATIPSVGLDEGSVVTARKKVLDIVEGNREAVDKLAALFDDYMYLATVDKEKLVREFGEADPPPDLERYDEEITKFLAAAREVRLMCTNVVRTGLYSVRCEKFKEQL